MTMNLNYNLNSETKSFETEKTNIVNNIKIDIPNYSMKIEDIELDLSKYKNNKPTRKIIRGRLLDE